MSSSPASAAVEATAVGRREHGVAAHGEQGPDPALAGGVDLLGQGGDRQLAADLGQAPHPGAEPAHAEPAPAAGSPAAAGPWAGSGNIIPPARSRLPARTFTTSIAQAVRAPWRTTLRADPPVDRGPRGGGQLAGEAADGAGVDPDDGRHPLGRRTGRRRARSSSSPLDVTLGRAEVDEVLGGERPWPGPAPAGRRCRAARSGARRRAPRSGCGPGSITTRRPPRSAQLGEPPGQVGRGPEAPVGLPGVGAEDDQQVGPVDVGDRDRGRCGRRAARTTRSGGSWSTEVAL